MKSIVKNFLMISVIVYSSCLAAIPKIDENTRILEKIRTNTQNTHADLNYKPSLEEQAELQNIYGKKYGRRLPTGNWSISVQLKIIRNYLQQILDILRGGSDSPNTSGWVFDAYNKLTQQLQDKNNKDAGAKLQSFREKMQNLVRYGLYKDNKELEAKTPFGRPLVKIPSDSASIVLANSKAAAQRKTATADAFIGQTVYADNIGKKNAKPNKTKEEEAERFVQNIAGNIAYPALEAKPASSEEAAKYISYVKAAGAIQSAIVDNLVDLYADRLPAVVNKDEKGREKILTSRAQLFKEMNTLEIKPPKKASFAGSIASMFFNIRAMNYSFYKIANDLDKLVLLQSMIATQNNFMNNYAYENLRGMAERAAAEEAERAASAKELIPQEKEK